MEKLNFPNFNLKLKSKKNILYIFDVIRKKWIKLTAEEWVRQHCINYLITNKKYPKSYINVEKKFLINGVNKRYDIVVYDKLGNISILVECKSNQILLDQKVFDQISKYNLKINSQYLMITNGITHYFCKIDYSPLL